MNKKEAVSFPQLLDSFGKHLESLYKEIEKDGLKPALMADIIKLLNLMLGLQQMTTMLYNITVINFESSQNLYLEKLDKLDKLLAKQHIT